MFLLSETLLDRVCFKCIKDQSVLKVFHNARSQQIFGDGIPGDKLLSLEVGVGVKAALILPSVASRPPVVAGVGELRVALAISWRLVLKI